MSVIDSNMISPPVITHISVEQSKAMYSEKCEDNILSFNDIDTALKERSNLPESSEEGPREAPVLEAERLEGVVGDSNDKKTYGSDLSIQNNDNGKRTNRESKTIDSGENPSDKTTCYPHPRLGSQCDLSGDTDLRNTITERSDNTVFCGGEHTIDSDDNMSKSESGEISSSSDLNDTRPSRLDTRHLETSLPLQTALDTPGSNDETTRSKNSEENHTLYNKTSTICSTAENSGKQESFQLIEDNESKIKVMDGSISGLASKSNCLSEMKDIVLDEITKGSSSAVCTTQSNPPHNTVFDDINSTENLYNKTNVSRDNSAGKKRRKSGGKSGSGEQKGSKCRGDNLDFTPFIYEKVESSLGNGLKVKYRRKSNEVIAERTMGSEDDAVKKDTSTVVNKGTNQSLKYSDRTKSGSCGNLSQISNYIVNVNSMKTESKGMKIESKGSVFVSESKSDSIVSRNSEQNSTEPQTTLFDKKLCTEIIVNDNIDTKSTSCNIVPGDVTNEHNIEQKCEELSQGAQSVNIQNSSSSLTEPLVDSNTGGAMSSPSHKMSIPPTSLLSSITSSLHPSPLTTIVPLVVMASSSSSNSSPETIVSTSTSVKTPLLSSTPSSPQFLQSSSPCRAHIVESSIHNAMESADGSITSTASISSSSCDETESDDCLRRTPKVVIRKLPDEIFQRYYYLRHELFPDEVEFSSSKQENRDLEISPGLVFKFKKYSPRSEQYKIRSKPQKPTVKNPTTKRSKSKKSGKAKRKTKKQVTRKGIKLNEEEAHVAKHIDDSALSNVATKSVKITDGENSSLVDPKIMSMSSALLQAFNKETPAESIAFKKRPKIKQSKTPKAFNPSKPASKLQKAYQQARTKKRGLIFEKRGALSNLSANKRPKECKSDVQNKPIRNAGASYCQDNRTNDIDIDQTNTTEAKVFAQSKRPKYKRKMSCPEPRNSRTLSKPSSVSDRNIFENDLFLEAKQMVLVSDEDQGNIFNNGKHNGLRRLKSTSNIARDTDLMFESYSDHLSKSDQAEYDTLSETEHLPKFEGDELEIGQSIIEHAKHWDSQESKSFSTRYSDTKFDMIASEIPQTETPAITSDLPKLSPVATEQEFDPDPRDSSMLPTLYPEGSKQLLSNATDRVKAEQIESPPNFASLWSSNLTSLSIDCAQPLDLSTAASPIGCDDRYRRLPSNVALSMSIPEIKITSPGSSITTFGQLTPVSNPPSCASLSPFLSPSQPPSSHRYRGLNSPSRSGGKRNVNHYAGKPSPLCHYSPNHARASRRDFYQDDSHESDDSDATVVYPKRCKTYSNRTSNTETSSHSVQSGLNTRKVVKQEYDFSNFESKLETCKNELASLVSDIRENVAKHKAMRRSRRTNSFSGENNLPITQPHQKIDNLSSSRPGLERFISVEPVMDSGTPYKSMSRDAGDDNLNFDGERKDQTLLDFVTMLNLQTETTNLQIETGSNGSESEAETKLYDMNFSHLSEDKDADKSKKCYPKTKSKFETDNKSSEGSTGLFSPGSRLEIDVEFNNGDIFSRDEQPHVVIENAESDHVILGKEAMKKMRSGIFQSTERNGKRFPKKRRKRSRLHFPTADFPLDDQSRNDDDVSETSSTSSNNSNHKRVKHTARELQLSLEEEGPRGSKLPSQSKDNNSSEDDRDGKPSKTMPSPGSTGSGNIGGGSREQQMHSAAIRSRSLSPGIAVGTKKPKPRKGRKPKPVAADPIAEHISQSSTARILQELPRFNWLEQKILQQSTNSYKQTTSATNNNNTNNSNNSNNNTNNNINNHNSSSNNNNNSSSSSSISPPTQRTISSKSSPHATGSSAGLPSPNNKSTCRLSNTSTPSPSSSSSTPSPSPSSLPAPPLISKRKDSSSSSSKGGDKNQRGGKFNVSSHGSPVDLRSDANSGHLKMTSVATPPPLKLPDDLTRKSPPAMTSEETKSSDADFEANVFPPIKNSCHPNNTTAHNINNNNRNSDSSSKNEGNSNNLSSDLATTSTTTTTTTITTASSIADDDSTDLPCDTELDLNIPSPENLTIDFGPCSSEHEEEKITDSSKTDGTVSGNTTKDNYDDGQETDVNKDQGNAADDTVIMVFNLKEASQGVSSDREESPRKPNGKQTSIDSNTSSSSASDFTDNEKTEPHQSPPSLAVKSPSHGLNEPVLVKGMTDDGINDGDKIVNVVADSVSIDYTKSPKQPPPLGPVTVTDNNYQENVSDSSQNPIVDDRVVASESVSRSDSPSAVTASSPASPTVLTSSLTTSMTTTTASHSAINTTVPSLVPVSSSPVTDVSSGAPLDLCLNKSDNSVNSIGSGAGRVKANLPVQMVLPQPQTQTGTSTAATTVTSHTPVDVTYTTWSSSIDQSKSADGQSDSEKLAATTSDPLIPNVPKKLKDGGTCYTQLKSLDLSSKLSVTSFAPSDCSSPLNLSDITRFSQDSAQDLTVRVGLVPTPKLNNPSDLSVKRSSDSESQDLVSRTSQNVTQNEALDMATTPVAKGEKKMTDAELEKEFQKHLIEFRALEKLAERKAQEQMQIGMLRKRKAEILRYYDLKRKKRAGDNTSSTTSVSSVQEKRSALKPAVPAQYPMRSVNGSPTTVASQSHSSMPSSLNPPHVYNESGSPIESSTNLPLVLTTAKNEKNEYSNLSKSATQAEPISDASIVTPEETSNTNQPSSPLALTVVSKSIQISQSNTTVSTASYPTKAHQNRRSEMPSFTSLTPSTTCQISTSVTGPYAKRNTILTEPFSHRRNSTQRDNNFQRAHNQRPFQSPGSLIISDIKSKADAVFNASSDSSVTSPSMSFSPCASTQPTTSKQTKPHSPEITAASPNNPSKHPVPDPIPPQQLPPPPAIYSSQYSPNEPLGFHNVPENYTMNGNDHPLNRSRPLSGPTKPSEAVIADMTRHQSEIIEKRPADPHQNYSQNSSKDPSQIPLTVSSPKEIKRPSTEPRSPPEGPKRFARKPRSRSGSKEHPLEPIPLMMHPAGLPLPVNMPPPAHSSTDAPRDDHSKHHFRNSQMGKMPRLPPPEYSATVAHSDHWQRPPGAFHPSLQVDKSLIHTKEANSEGPIPMSQDEVQSKYREGPKPMRQHPPEVMVMAPNNAAGKAVPSPHSPNNYYWSQSQANARTTGAYIPAPQGGLQHRDGPPHLPPPPLSSASSSLSLSSTTSSSSSPSSSASSTHQQPPALSTHAGTYPSLHSKRQQHLYQQQQQMHHHQKQQYLMQLQHHHHHQQQQQQHPPDQMLQVPHGPPGSYNGQSRLPSPDDRQPVPMYPMGYPPHGQKMRHPPPHPGPTQPPQHQTQPPPPPQQQAPPHPHPPHPHPPHPHPHPQQRHPKQQPPAPPLSQQSSAVAHHPPQISSSSANYQTSIPGPLHPGMPQPNQPPMSGEHPSGPVYMGPPGSAPSMPGASLIRIMAPHKWIALDGSLRQHPSQPPQSTLAPGPHNLQSRSAHPHSPTHPHLSPQQQQQPPPPPPQQQQPPHPPPPPPSHSQHPQQPRMSRHDEPPTMPQQHRGGPGGPSSLHPSMAQAQAHAYNPREAQFPPPGAHGAPSSSSASASATSPSNASNSLCQLCGKMAAFLCSNCRRVWYCNEQCQSKHWSVHAAECKPATADPHYN